jgi:hypothetical protein
MQERSGTAAVGGRLMEIVGMALFAIVYYSWEMIVFNMVLYETP